MIKTKRIQQIKEYVFDRESASLDELVAHFGVSKTRYAEMYRHWSSLACSKSVWRSGCEPFNVSGVSGAKDPSAQ
ncbi:hypothetical protein BsIDN1_35300 [Bacillus safensis]|uniref:HTH deoR-type domain-containing protein n=1 Tax=Bacillus safensis TaxID=561879 RepID=A0A5S9MBE1_BACIA|nr:hypothetical protein BsIDN1_35300 [Bacillus safensis]